MEIQMTRQTKAEKADRLQHATAALRKYIKSGDTLYCTLSHVSASGMQRGIQVLVPVQDEEGKLRIYDLSWAVSVVIGWSMHRKGGVKVEGCGMDMGFHLVYTLSSILFRDQDRGGYQLKSEWL